MKRALASLEARSRKLFTCSACGAEGLDEPLESKCHCNEDGAHWIESVVYTAPPAPEFYKIGDATMRHIFTPTGITDVSDMQAVFDQIETVLAGMWQPAPVSVPDELTREEYKRRFMEDDNFDDTFRGGWNACRATMLNGGKS
ncbi:hypothetical protein [Enterobacter ludwigii]